MRCWRRMLLWALGRRCVTVMVLVSAWQTCCWIMERCVQQTAPTMMMQRGACARVHTEAFPSSHTNALFIGEERDIEIGGVGSVGDRVGRESLQLVVPCLPVLPGVVILLVTWPDHA